MKGITMKSKKGEKVTELTTRTSSMQEGCDHAWAAETLREPNFGVAFASIRTCRKCGKRQGQDHTVGRTGGPIVDLQAKKATGIEVLPGKSCKAKVRVDTPEGCRKYFEERLGKFVDF
jgi:hypothetical protein